MYRNIVFRIIAGIVLLAAIAGLGIFAYQAGVAHGVAANLQVPASQAIPYGHFMGFHGLGLFGVLFAFFLLCLAFGAMRRLIWGPRWGMRHMRLGPMGHLGPRREGVPPMFTEWHRRAHEAAKVEEAPEGSQN
jgi:hypothetical protein